MGSGIRRERAKGGAVNLRDIARLAGVSRSTVSRVINDDPRVSDEVRGRVKAIIEREGYHPHAAARALATRRSGVFGLVIPQAIGSLFGDPWFPRFTQGCLDAARECGVTLMLLMEPANDQEAVARLIDRFVVTRHIDGLVLAASMQDDLLISALSDLGFPYMLVGRPRDEGRNFVDIRNREAAAEATRHLLSHGRTRPAMIAGPAYMISALDRRAGFEDAVVEAGCDLAQVPVREVNFSQQDAYQETLALLESTDRPDAIFAASDAMAFGVMQAARQLGLRVPEDVALMGFDGFESDRIWYWDLSTVRQPAHEIGFTAVSRLNDIANHRSQESEHVWLETELVLRRSCGCPTPPALESTQSYPEKGGVARSGRPFVADSRKPKIDRP